MAGAARDMPTTRDDFRTDERWPRRSDHRVPDGCRRPRDADTRDDSALMSTGRHLLERRELEIRPAVAGPPSVPCVGDVPRSFVTSAGAPTFRLTASLRARGNVVATSAWARARSRRPIE